MSLVSRFRRRVPSATYRLQFNREFGFRAALEVVDYLHALGISDCYASPLLQARPNSTHGYDICAFNRINPALGTTEGFDRFSGRLQELEMGLLLDMVPNHMGADPSNAWWADVLEKGRESRYAKWFDINWEPAAPDLHNKVLLPVLEDSYARVLEAGKLQVVWEHGRLALKYHDRRFPLSSASCARILDELTKNNPGFVRESAGAKKSRRLPGFAPRAELPADFDFSALNEQFGALVERSPTLRAESKLLFRRLNGRPWEPDTFNELHALMREQHYRLADWRVGPEEINYRRFFDITELVSLRMELPEVFEATHALVLGLLNEGKVTGLRIDHPDGLWDPKQYFERLQMRANAGASPAVSPDRGTPRSRGQTLPTGPHECGVPAELYVVVEKILSPGEELPRDWPVGGTTGYDFLNQVNGLFVDSRNSRAFDAIYQGFTGRAWDLKSVVEHSKKQVLLTSFRSELATLTQRLKRLAEESRYGQDLTFRELRQALIEVIAAFPVYRTYVDEKCETVPPEEELQIREALTRARAAGAALDPAAFDFIENLLLLHPPADLEADERSRWRRFVLRLQQLTGPVMAKGLEDTAFYNFNRLVSLNEVGGDPSKFGNETNSFHSHNIAKAQLWPHSLLATSTHDTKRGEDARARINVLSEMPERWREAVTRWKLFNEGRKSLVNNQPVPDSNDEYSFYQNLVGAWTPKAETKEGLAHLRERLRDYMLKAIREAKAHTSWTNPNTAYEEATALFTERALSDSVDNRFLTEFKTFERSVDFFGKLNSLSQTLLKMTSPGVPDFYQGSELWDFNLVDPDNRRPVDYSIRRQLLADLHQRFGQGVGNIDSLLEQLLQTTDTGQIKLYLIWRTLQFRLSQRELFERGAYIPLTVSGAKADHLCAFARSLGECSFLVMVPRLVFGLTRGVERFPLGEELWQDTYISLPAPGRQENFRNVLTGEIHSVSGAGNILQLSKVFARFPVALMERS